MRQPRSKTSLSKTSLYVRWKHMIDRCEKATDPKYPRYGGRGIRVCERWHDFDKFREDVGEPPPGMSLDRIDVDGHYEAGNCRWADQKTQQNNRSNNRFITYRGQRKPIAEWAAQIGIRTKILRQRLDRDGMTVEQALTLPHGGRRWNGNQWGKTNATRSEQNAT